MVFADSASTLRNQLIAKCHYLYSDYFSLPPHHPHHQPRNSRVHYIPLMPTDCYRVVNLKEGGAQNNRVVDVRGLVKIMSINGSGDKAFEYCIKWGFHRSLQFPPI